MLGSLPEVTFLADARGERPENAVGIGDFWYEPEVWSLPISPTARVLYASLCSYLGHREINRRDLRNALKDNSDEEMAAALEELVHQGLLHPTPERASGRGVPGYSVHAVSQSRGLRG